jgi:hypothetical protein
MSGRDFHSEHELYQPTNVYIDQTPATYEQWWKDGLKICEFSNYKTTI